MVKVYEFIQSGWNCDHRRQLRIVCCIRATNKGWEVDWIEFLALCSGVGYPFRKEVSTKAKRVVEWIFDMNFLEVKYAFLIVEVYRTKLLIGDSTNSESSWKQKPQHPSYFCVALHAFHLLLISKSAPDLSDYHVVQPKHFLTRIESR